MKRFFVWILCFVLMFSLAACGETEDNTSSIGSDSSISASDQNTDTESDRETDTDTDTDQNTTSSVTETEPWEGYVFDDSVEHKFLATDIRGHSIVVFDLNKTNGDLDLLTGRSCIVWAWSSDSDSNCTIKPGAGIDAAKYRYSAYYEKDVIIACASSGWAGIIDYETHSLIWEYKVGEGPHSIEMMPNGDLVVACSGNGKTEGKLVYIPLSAGKKSPSCEVVSPSSHGVMWDPQNECLWVMEHGEVAGFKVKGYGTADAQLERAEGLGASLIKDNNGHVLSPVIGQPGKYWVGAGSKLWQFDAKEQTITDAYDYAGALSLKNLKGVASFADGTAVQTAAGLGGDTSYDWSSKALRILLFKESSDGTLRPVVKQVAFKTREFYKVFPFTKDYQ